MPRLTGPSQIPSPSVSGSKGSVPRFNSSVSSRPSLSSSVSSLSPTPSPSLSFHSFPSVGKGSGPSLQTSWKAKSPSQIPSESVSTEFGFVPNSISCKSVRLSSSESLSFGLVWKVSTSCPSNRPS